MSAVGGQLAPEGTSALLDSLLTSYEERVSSIGTLLDTTFQFFQETQNPLAGLKEERERVNAELRDQLARTSSLRRTDFDRMMQELLASQREQEAGVRSLLNDYLDEQKAIARELRDSLTRVRDSVAEDKTAAAKRLHEQLKETPVRQEKCRTEICAKLKQFQQRQETLTSELKELLARGEDLKIRDFKLMLGRFKNDRAKRLARQQERKEETRNLLSGFREERAKIEPPRTGNRVAAAQSMPSVATNPIGGITWESR